MQQNKFWGGIYNNKLIFKMSYSVMFHQCKEIHVTPLFNQTNLIKS